MAIHSKVVVLGAGPGGYAAAFMAADLGLETTIVEADPRLGGTCLLRGCIPSKALLHVAKVMSEAEEMHEWGIEFNKPKISIDKVRARKEKVIDTLTGGLAQLAKRRNVRVINARGIFVDSQTLQLEGGDKSTYESERLTFDYCILATGSVPAMPKMFKIDSPRVMDSTGALALEDIPESLLVIGGGYIGLELGTAYMKLGSQLTVIEGTDQLLPGNDPELVNVVARKLKKHGAEVHLNCKAQGWEETKDGAAVRVETKEGVKTFVADAVFVTVGRRPNSENLGLEKLGVKIEKGFIPVDKQQRTNVAGIFAIGDVAQQPMLAHKAYKEAEVLAEVLAGHKSENDAVAIPAVIFTDPEIATVGLMEHEAAKIGRKVKTGKMPFAALGRALAIAETDGFVKVIADAGTDELLGLAVVGPEASDLISEGALALEMGAFLPDLGLTIHPHPTLGEAIMEAAKAALGESGHLVNGGKRPERPEKS
jgi:dihydrolipoamide dehydrogenase